MENQTAKYWWDNLEIGDKSYFTFETFDHIKYEQLTAQQIERIFLSKNSSDKVCLFLDDVRPTPKGWLRFRTAESLIEFLTWNKEKVYAVSLDNDLGPDYTEGRMVANWIEENAFHGTLKPIPHLAVHSDNNVAIAYINAAFNNAKKYWEQDKANYGNS